MDQVTADECGCEGSQSSHGSALPMLKLKAGVMETDGSVTHPATGRRKGE